MGLTTHLNPEPWRDEDRRDRSVAQPPQSGLGAALGASFEPQPLPACMTALLERLR